MDTSHTIDVSALDATHRRAIEDVIGMPLQTNQRLSIEVKEIDVPSLQEDTRPAQTVEDWKSVYDGLTEEQIETVDRIAKTRANLTRHLP